MAPSDKMISLYSQMLQHAVPHKNKTAFDRFTKKTSSCSRHPSFKIFFKCVVLGEKHYKSLTDIYENFFVKHL